MQQQNSNKYIKFIDREFRETSIIHFFFVTAENLIWPVVFLIFCSW